MSEDMYLDLTEIDYHELAAKRGIWPVISRAMRSAVPEHKIEDA